VLGSFIRAGQCFWCFQNQQVKFVQPRVVGNMGLLELSLLGSIRMLPAPSGMNIL
jgi:hypothetical protein